MVSERFSYLQRHDVGDNGTMKNYTIRREFIDERTDLPSINHLYRTIILIIMRTLPTLATTKALGPNTHSIPNLNVLHLRANLDDLANDLMADGERVRHVTPSSGDGVEIRGTDTARIDLDVDVVVGELLELEGPLVEVCVGFCAVDLEADCFFWVGHVDVERGDVQDLKMCNLNLISVREITCKVMETIERSVGRGGNIIKNKKDEACSFSIRQERG